MQLENLYYTRQVKKLKINFIKNEYLPENIINQTSYCILLSKKAEVNQLKKGLDHLKPHIEDNPTHKTEHEKNPSNLKKRMKDLLPIQNINSMSINE